jgi:hypothetical protein
VSFSEHFDAIRSTKPGFFHLFWPEMVLFGWFFCLLVTNIIWLQHDQQPLTWDPAHHLRYGLTYADLLQSMDWSRVWYHWVMSIFLILDRSLFAASVSNMVWIAALLLGTYKAGALLWGKKTGLLAGILVSSYPMIIGFSRLLYTDLSTVALTALSFWLLLRSNRFQNRKASLAFGVSLGLGLLTKPTYPTFIAFPCLIMAWWIATDETPRHSMLHDTNFLTNVGLAGLATLLVSSLYYGVMGKHFLDLFILHLRWNTEHLPLWSLRSLFYYPLAFVNQQVSLSLAVFFVIGLIFFLRQARHEKFKALLTLSGVIGPVLLQTFIINKHTHQDMGILPFVALSTAAGLASIPSVRWRRALISITVLLGIVQVYLLSFGPLPAIAEAKWHIGPFAVAVTPPMSRQPAPTTWPVREAVAFMASGAKPETPKQVAVICDTAEINGSNFAAWALMDRLPVTVYKARDLNIDGFRQRFASFDFVVIQNDWQPPDIQTSNPLLAPNIDVYMLNYFRNHQDEFYLASNMELPHGNNLLVYGRLSR